MFSEFPPNRHPIPIDPIGLPFDGSCLAFYSLLKFGKEELIISHCFFGSPQHYRRSHMNRHVKKCDRRRNSRSRKEACLPEFGPLKEKGEHLFKSPLMYFLR